MQGIIYTRVSSDEQIKGMSLEFQREDCLKYACSKGIDVAAVFEERGESAKFADRPELLKLLDHCKKNKGRINSVIVWKLDRLSRNQMDYYFIKRTLLDYGITIHSATEPSIEDSSSIAGKVFETFSALQAEIDNTIRRDRSVRGMSAKISAGLFPWKPPLGYHCAQNRLKGLKKTDPDEPDPERFPLIKRLFATCLHERVLSSVALADLANGWGLRTRTGSKIYPQIVDRILGNKFYAGILVDPWTKEETEGKHERVLSLEDFTKIHALRSGKAIAPSPRKDEHPDFPLRRTVRCGTCTRPLTGSWSRGNGGRYPYYHCANKRCSAYGKGVRKSALEGEFLRKLSEITPSKRVMAVLTNAVSETWKIYRAASQTSAQQSEKARKELQARLERLIDMKERELLTDEEFLERKSTLRAQIESAQAPAVSTDTNPDDLPQLLDGAATFVATLPQHWLEMDYQLRSRFEKSVFPDGICYDRGHGFGTTRLGPIYELSEFAAGSNAHLVHRVRESWNSLLEEFRLLADVAAEHESASALPKEAA